MAVPTLYHVLQEVDGPGGTTYVPVAANVGARSTDDALRHIVKETGRYVAIPQRSFQPTAVTVETETVVRVGTVT